MTIIQIIGFLEQINEENKELVAKEMIWKKFQNWKDMIFQAEHPDE